MSSEPTLKNSPNPKPPTAEQERHSREALERETALKRLQAEHIQRELRAAWIADAHIPGLGRQVVERLAKHEITSAQDITHDRPRQSAHAAFHFASSNSATKRSDSALADAETARLLLLAMAGSLSE